MTGLAVPSTQSGSASAAPSATLIPYDLQTDGCSGAPMYAGRWVEGYDGALIAAVSAAASAN